MLDKTFHVQHAPSAGLVAQMNQTALEHVLMNLLLNARAASGGGGVQISARSTGARVVISVVYQGTGIDPARLRGIFSPFVSDSPKGGRGLGLTVSQFLVKAAGGSIEADSQVGKGSCFNIYLRACERGRAAA
jgi:C4-dicarboxylate-specific signal transduction histidine kinase